MKTFLAVSLGKSPSEALRRPVDAALACLADEGASVKSTLGDDGWIAFSGAESIETDQDPAETGDGAFTYALGKLLWRSDAAVAPRTVASLVASADPALANLFPPFAVVHRAGPAQPVLAAVDWLGFFQLYFWQGQGVAAISTSARALAALAGGTLDYTGVGVQSMIGWHIGDATIFDGVRVLPAASIATLHHGNVSVREYVGRLSYASSGRRAPSLDDAVEEMAEILKSALERFLGARDGVVLQLTGGHDSRILLGAISLPRRQGLRALTLGDEGNRDVAIAADLCRRYGMVHQVHRVDGQAWPSDAGVHDLMMNAARALECQASPIALTPLLLAESHLAQGHRLSGLGGEVARGFYYSGQPKGAVTSPALIRRLAQWRLCINEAVEPGVLSADFVASARSETAHLLEGLFPGGDWLRATDEFYLYQRMRRWAGAHGTVATMRRESLNAMFDRRFIELALAVDPTEKRDSQLLGRLMMRLDRGLADLPLDIGLVPSRLARRSAGTRIITATLAGRRLVRKAWQRATGGRRPQAGATTAAHRLLQHWRAAPDVCAPLFDVPIIREDWLRGVIAGDHQVKPTTMAFLADLLVATTLKP